jgi:hypothetical protein
MPIRTPFLRFRQKRWDGNRCFGLGLTNWLHRRRRYSSAAQVSYTPAAEFFKEKRPAAGHKAK